MKVIHSFTEIDVKGIVKGFCWRTIPFGAAQYLYSPPPLPRTRDLRHEHLSVETTYLPYGFRMTGVVSRMFIIIMEYVVASEKVFRKM